NLIRPGLMPWPGGSLRSGSISRAVSTACSGPASKYLVMSASVGTFSRARQPSSPRRARARPGGAVDGSGGAANKSDEEVRRDPLGATDDGAPLIQNPVAVRERRHVVGHDRAHQIPVRGGGEIARCVTRAV